MDKEIMKEEIKRRTSCAKYLEKSERGGLYKCPFCGSGNGKNKTGALKVYSTNTWTCHSCKKSGDVIDLIKERYSINYNDALIMAAAESNMTIDSRNTTEQSEITNHTAYYKECAARLINSPEAISYLSGRGISIDTAMALDIGFDFKADPAQSGHETPRIIIPVTKDYYVGRSINANVPKAFQKLNNKGGKPGIFNVDVLYSDARIIYITEGAFDAMSICEMGSAAIALNSTGNVDRLIEQLKQQPVSKGKAFVIAFDNDSDLDTATKTKAAAEKLKNKLQKLNYNSIIFNVAGNCKDANEALLMDKRMFEELLQAAEEKLNQDYLMEFLKKIQTDAYKPYKTGLSFFDDLLNGGVIQQSLLILMAAPGTGKTTLCQQIAEEMAAHKKPVVYINLEMSREQMLAKAISSYLTKHGKNNKTALEVLQGYNWSTDDKQLIMNAVETYRYNIYPYIKYNPENIGNNLDDILDYLYNVGEQAKANGEQAPAIIVDYLHLITTNKNLDNQELIKQTVMGLKHYAINYDSFVIGISATNRFSNITGKITMESGRDSSNIEYTGDYQLSLNYYAIDNGDIKPSDTKKLAELQQTEWRQMIIRVLKGRFIAPGKSANVYFHAANNTFYGENDPMPTGANQMPFDESSTILRAGNRR